MLSDKKYFNKYLKYKQKYLDKQKGGTNRKIYIIYNDTKHTIYQLCNKSNNIHNFIANQIFEYWVTSSDDDMTNGHRFWLVYILFKNTLFLYLIKSPYTESISLSLNQLDYKMIENDIKIVIRDGEIDDGEIDDVKIDETIITETKTYLYNYNNFSLDSILKPAVKLLMKNILFDFAKKFNFEDDLEWLKNMCDTTSSTTIFDSFTELPNILEKKILFIKKVLLSFCFMQSMDIPKKLSTVKYQKFINLVKMLKKDQYIPSPTFKDNGYLLLFTETDTQNVDAYHFFKFIKFKIILEYLIVKHSEKDIDYFLNIIPLPDQITTKQELIKYLKPYEKPDKKINENPDENTVEYINYLIDLLKSWGDFIETIVVKCIIVRGCSIDEVKQNDDEIERIVKFLEIPSMSPETRPPTTFVKKVINFMFHEESY